MPATDQTRLQRLSKPIAALLFLLAAMALAAGAAKGGGNYILLLSATLAAGYLALTIGANDAANNIGAAVGAGAITLGGALAVAAAGELAGGFLASSAVSDRLREGIFQPLGFGDGMELARVLFGGMLAAAIWLHLATFLRIPISATHSVIGGLIGAGVFARGWEVVQWEQIGWFAVAWVLAPILAAGIAAVTLRAIYQLVLTRPNLTGAARTHMPALVTLLALVLTHHFFLRIAPDEWYLTQHHLLVSLIVALAVFLIAQPWVHRTTQTIKNNRQGVSRLFTLPLILAAGFFAFSHGANDTANVAAPLAVIAEIASEGNSPPRLALPTWAVAVGVFGIVTGLLLYGSRIVRTVGSEITEIDRPRAFSIMFSSAVVIVIASLLGYPVSTTHTVVGSIFGIGLLREILKLEQGKTLEKIRKCHEQCDDDRLDAFLQRFRGATLPKKKRMLKALFQEHGAVHLDNEERRNIHQRYHRELLRRPLLRRIVIAWILTIPAAGLLGGIVFHLSG